MGSFCWGQLIRGCQDPGSRQVAYSISAVRGLLNCRKLLSVDAVDGWFSPTPVTVAERDQRSQRRGMWGIVCHLQWLNNGSGVPVLCHSVPMAFK